MISTFVKRARLIAMTTAFLGFTAVTGAHAALIDTNSTFGAFDASSGTRTFSISGAASVNDVDISISFAKCDDPAITVPGPCTNGGNAFLSEIVFRLTSPGGTTVNLVNAFTYSGSAGGSVVVTFDDEAAAPVGGSTLQNGSFRPVGSLADFDGQDPTGIWTLFIQDTVGADPLSYFSATLSVNGGESVPEPASLALLGLGLLGLGFARKRKQA